MSVEREERWLDADGRPLGGGALGPGEFVAVVHKSPDRMAEAPCEDSGGVVGWARHAAALVVADGVGGHQNGAVASRALVDALCERLAALPADPAAMSIAVLDGIERTNEALLRRGDGAATTALVALVDGDVLRTFHAGDSELLVVGQRGRIKRHTISHSPVGYAVESGVIGAREGFAHEDRHIVSNVVGMAGMHVEVGSSMRLRPRDTLVLASDGLWDNLYREEVAEFVRKGPLAVAAERLVAKCLARMRGQSRKVVGKADDLTIVLYRPS